MRSLAKQEEDVKLFEQYLDGKNGRQLAEEKGVSYSRINSIINHVRRVLTHQSVFLSLDPALLINEDTIDEMRGCVLQHSREFTRTWRFLIAAWRDAHDPNFKKPCKVAMTDNVSVLELVARTTNCLHSANVLTIEQLLLLTESEVMEIPNMGRKSTREIMEALAENGLTLKPAEQAKVVEQQIADQYSLSIGFTETKLPMLEKALGAMVVGIVKSREASDSNTIDEKSVAAFMAATHGLEEKHPRVVYGCMTFDRNMRACLRGEGITLWAFEVYMRLLDKKKITITVE